MDKKLKSKNKIITSSEQWKEVKNHFKTTTWLGLDTEFMRDSSYYPQLCLVQLSCDEVDICLDPLAFECSTILADLLENKKITKIIHSASQDIEALGYYCDCEINAIYDTQLAAEFCNLVPQIGYASLVNELLNVELPKSQTRSNWAKRPLTQRQIEYSFNDVIYLKPLYDELNQRLGDLKKSIWYEQEQVNESNRMKKYKVDPKSAYLNFKSSHRLAVKNQQVIKQVITWREEFAQRVNRPRHWVLTDKSIAEIGAQLPNDIDALQQITKDDQRFSKRNLADVMNCINVGLDQPEIRVWQHREQLTEPQKLEVNTLKRKLEKQAFKHNLPTTRLATRRDIVDYVRDGSGRLAVGWRKEILNALNNK